MSARNHFALLLVATIALYKYQSVSGYDLIQMRPIPRGGRWRYNASVLPDYHDDQMNCGGYSVNQFWNPSNQCQFSVITINSPLWQVQYVKNNGSCGPCGDDFSLPTPRPHETGGIYADPDFRTVYRQLSSAQVDLFIPSEYLNANISFDLCHLSDHKNNTESEDCFEQHKLHYTTTGYVASVGADNTQGLYTFLVQMPFMIMKRAILRVSATTGTYCK